MNSIPLKSRPEKSLLAKSSLLNAERDVAAGLDAYAGVAIAKVRTTKHKQTIRTKTFITLKLPDTEAKFYQGIF